MPQITQPEFDAVLLLSFGGPEGPDDVIPFLENVTRGRGIPPERLAEVGEHYFQFGGISPINGQCRDLLAALGAELEREGPRLPLYWGNRNWTPMLADTLSKMADDGVRRAVAVTTSAFSSYSACRQYLDDIDRAREVVGERAPIVEKLAPYWNHPSFIDTMIANTKVALEELGDAGAGARLVFTAHSIPMAMATGSDYEVELREAAALVAAAAAPNSAFDLVFQSRSGPPTQPWLEPDICDHLRALSAARVGAVVLIPIGFVSDHMEVLFDLDTEARAVAGGLDLPMKRAATVGIAPRFVSGLRELIADHLCGREPQSVGERGARSYPCAPGCCAYVPRRPTSRPEAK